MRGKNVADSGPANGRSVPALRFKQWLNDWNEYDFSQTAHRRRPQQYLYIFSMAAAELRKLCDVYKRERDGIEAEGIQRVRDASRTERIQRYVRLGYPYGDLKPPQRLPETLSLRKPGWLPTAIVINILVEGDERHGRTVRREHLAKIKVEDGARCSVEVPLFRSSVRTASHLSKLSTVSIASGPSTPSDKNLQFRTISNYRWWRSMGWTSRGKPTCFGQ